MTSTPEPAVGQVWANFETGHCFALRSVDYYNNRHVILCNVAMGCDLRFPADGFTYLGTLDELREHQALRAKNEALSLALVELRVAEENCSYDSPERQSARQSADMALGILTP